MEGKEETKVNSATGKIKVLMIGTDKSTGGGMWTVASNYISSESFKAAVELKYIPTFVVGSSIKRVLFALSAYLRILYALISYKPQILHVHMAEKGSVYRKGIAIWMARKFRCKIIIHMHGAEFQTWYDSLNEEKKKKVSKILNYADKIIILGRYWISYIRTIVPENRIVVVYNAVNQKEYLYNPEGATVLFLGAVGQRKGAYDLLTAFSEIADEIPNTVKLKYYGPDFEHKITELIENSGLSDRIYYCGWLDNEHKKEVFSDTICSVLPSYNEGLPMTILETMAAGIPNISTSVAAIPEVINEANGYVIEPGNVAALKETLIDVCNDMTQRIKKSKAAYDEIKNRFTMETHIKHIISIYEELI